jgi:hypothetical protein
MNIWELLKYGEIICPSCGSSWCPTITQPLSCPRCKSYTVSKNRQTWPEGYSDVFFTSGDFAIYDPEWKTHHDFLDQEQKARKRDVFEKIAERW